MAENSNSAKRIVLIVEDAESCATTLEIALLAIPDLSVRITPSARQSTAHPGNRISSRISTSVGSPSAARVCGMKPKLNGKRRPLGKIRSTLYAPVAGSSLNLEPALLRGLDYDAYSHIHRSLD